MDVAVHCLLEFLDMVDVDVVLGVCKVDNDSSGAESSSPADSMQVGLLINGEVIIDHQVDSLDVDAPPEEIGGYQYPRPVGLELVVVVDSLLLAEARVDGDRVEEDLVQLLGHPDGPLDLVDEDDGLAEGNVVKQLGKKIKLVLFRDYFIELMELFQI